MKKFTETNVTLSSLTKICAQTLTAKGYITLAQIVLAVSDALGTAATVDTGTTEGTIPVLGAGGKLSASLIPALDLVDALGVADETERLALTLAQAQGVIVVQADDGSSWALVADGVPANAGDWLRLNDPALTWDDVDDKPTEFPPESHSSSHAAGGADPLTPADIGALAVPDSAKETIHDNDLFVQLDSENGYVPRTTVWTLIKSTLATVFDSLYAPIGHNHDEAYQPAGSYATGTGSADGVNTGDQDLSGLVPYTGATGTADLGDQDLYARWLAYNGGSIYIDLQGLAIMHATYKTIDFNSNQLCSTSSGSNSVLSLDWETRKIYASDGTTLQLDWSNPVGVGIARSSTPDAKLAIGEGAAGYANFGRPDAGVSTVFNEIIGQTAATVNGTLFAIKQDGSMGGAGSVFSVGTVGAPWSGIRVTETLAVTLNPNVNFNATGGGATLSFGGSGNTNTFNTFNSGSQTSTDFQFNAGSADRTAGNLFQIANYTAPVFTIKAVTGGGYVGIMNSSPTEALDVTGNAKISGNTTLAAYSETVVALGTVGSSATIVITGGTHITATLTSSTPCTFTMPTAAAGKSFILHLKQAATPTTAAFTSVLWSGGTTYVATAVAGRVDILSFTTTPNSAGNGYVWVGSSLPNITLP